MKTRAKGLALGLAVGIGSIVTLGSAVSADKPGDAAEDSLEGPDVAIVGVALEQASAAALEFTGEGQVTATEVEDEESYYEVEVKMDDGREVDVQLDESFNVVGTD